jgi:transcriptional antiterminator RfaH
LASTRSSPADGSVAEAAARRWYVFHTQQHAERRAAAHLARQGFEAFVPLHVRRRRHARRIEQVAAPLFPRYGFVRLDLAADRWRSINGTVGVQRLIAGGERPAPVPVGIVEALRQRSDAAGVVPTSALRVFARGDKLRISEGIFSDHVGLYERLTADERVVLLLEVLGREVEIAVPYTAVDAA